METAHNFYSKRSLFAASGTIESRQHLLAMVAYVEAVKEELREEPRSESEQNKKDSGTKVAERTGIPKSTASQARSHVETADAFPFMQTWPQYRVLEARE